MSIVSHFKGGKLLVKFSVKLVSRRWQQNKVSFLKPLQMFIELGPGDGVSSKLN